MKNIREANPSCVIKDCSLDNVEFGKYVTILTGAYLKDVIIKDFSYVSYESRISNASVGKFCSIGPRLQIGLAPHPTRTFVSTYPAFYSQSNSGCAVPLRNDDIFIDSIPATSIGNDVWIGTDVIVPGGVSIGTGSVIGAGSVVVKDIPPFAIVGGNPAGIIRFRFTQEEIDILLNSMWWDWPFEEIKNNVDIFCNIKDFIRYIQKRNELRNL